VNHDIGKMHLNKGNKLNSIWRQDSTDDKLFDFLQESVWGQAVYNLLTVRGNHTGYSK